MSSSEGIPLMAVAPPVKVAVAPVGLLWLLPSVTVFPLRRPGPLWFCHCDLLLNDNTCCRFICNPGQIIN
jgi:hypothetical protein